MAGRAGRSSCGNGPTRPRQHDPVAPTLRPPERPRLPTYAGSFLVRVLTGTSARSVVGPAWTAGQALLARAGSPPPLARVRALEGLKGGAPWMTRRMRMRARDSGEGWDRIWHARQRVHCGGYLKPSGRAPRAALPILLVTAAANGSSTSFPRAQRAGGWCEPVREDGGTRPGAASLNSGTRGRSDRVLQPAPPAVVRGRRGHVRYQRARAETLFGPVAQWERITLAVWGSRVRIPPGPHASEAETRSRSFRVRRAPRVWAKPIQMGVSIRVVPRKATSSALRPYVDEGLLFALNSHGATCALSE